MRPAIVTGVCPVLETPFDREGRVDTASFEALIEHHLRAGVRSVMFPGYASEFHKLTDEERNTLTAVLLSRTRGVPDFTAVISVPDHATAVAVERARAAARQGADAVNVLPPHLLGPSADAVREHIAAVAEAVNPTPVILQYAPAQTGTALDAASIARIADAAPNLVQVKVESTPPGALISALGKTTPALSSLVGYGGVQLIDALRRGAVGVQPGSSFPELYLRIWRDWHRGETEAAIALHARLLPYLSYWMQSVELIIAAEKRISLLRGIIRTDVCRAPYRELDAYESASIDRFLAEFEDDLAAGVEGRRG